MSFREDIKVYSTKTRVHADEFNANNRKLLDNDKYLKRAIEGLVTIDGHSEANLNLETNDGTINGLRVGGHTYSFKGEKGEKGEPGVATVAIDDTVENAQQTWSSEKIKSEILGGSSFSVVKRKIVKE